jgi:predicted outer membrane repeat protein
MAEKETVLNKTRKVWLAKLKATAICYLGLVAMNVPATIRYVDLNCTNATPPFTNWPTAATNIQDAVDASIDGDEVVVTNGVYASGGRAVYGTMTNRVAIDKPLLVRSLNGPSVTFITGQPAPGTTTNGDGAIRCAYVGANAVLSGFTLTNGHTQTIEDSKAGSGGGAWCEPSGVVTNCTLSGNSASYLGGGGAFGGTLNNCTFTRNSANHGGGALAGTLNNCTLTGNSASAGGGGASGGTLSNCTLTSNSAWVGGGAAVGWLFNCTLIGNSASNSGGGAVGGRLNNCTLIGNSASNSAGGADGRFLANNLNNCIVYYNRANSDANYSGNGFVNSCTTPLPSGLGNITNEPLFMDTNGWSNLRLQSDSPCINAGNNAYVTNSTDLDGNPRIAGGKVDMGAYEFQGTGLSGFTGWLWQYGLRVDGTADSADSDGDTANNWREWIADTDPTNALSVLKMLSPASAELGVMVSWQSVNTRSYFLERATDVGTQPPFQILQSNITGQAGMTSYTDTNAINAGPYYYRVGIQP